MPNLSKVYKFIPADATKDFNMPGNEKELGSYMFEDGEYKPFPGMTVHIGAKYEKMKKKVFGIKKYGKN